MTELMWEDKGKGKAYIQGLRDRQNEAAICCNEEDWGRGDDEEQKLSFRYGKNLKCLLNIQLERSRCSMYKM